jgi:2-amino-4-hydroxy-6-hydroxymethyldihydropteridine diphosphokinase
VPTTAYIALGSNLGDRAAHIDAALQQIDRIPNTRITARSQTIETAPVGPPGQGHYLNAVCAVQTSLGPRALLDHLLAIERSRGRERDPAARWGPRTLDLDLLLYDNQTIDEPGLTIPHPRLAQRPFVLEPLAQIAPDLTPPGHTRTIAQLLAAAQPHTRPSPRAAPA